MISLRLTIFCFFTFGKPMAARKCIQTLFKIS